MSWLPTPPGTVPPPGSPSGSPGPYAGRVHADALPKEVSRLEEYNAVVLGGAAYMFHWLKDATKFAKPHQAALQQRPVWLFSSGPFGTDEADEEGHDVRRQHAQRSFRN